MTEKRIIKKYANRRLYDTEIGRYITLDDVKELVFNHIDFQVIDAKTKKDLTQTTLLQIIAEQETSDSPLFSNDVLKDFICFYQEKSQNAFNEYMEHAMDVYMTQRDFFKTQWDAYQKLLSKAFVKKPHDD